MDVDTQIFHKPLFGLGVFVGRVIVANNVDVLSGFNALFNKGASGNSANLLDFLNW